MKSYLRSFYILTTAFAIIFLSVVLFIYIYASQLIENNQEIKLSNQLEHVDHLVDNFFEELIVTVNNTIKYIETEPSDQDLFNYLVNIDQASSKIASIYLGRADKTMVNSTGFVPGPSFDLTTRPWYIAASDSDDVVFTPAFINATQDKIIMNVARSVYINDVFIGVVSTDVDITTISETISSIHIGSTGFAFLIDSHHNFVAFPGMDTSNLELIALDDQFDLLESDEENVFDYNVKFNRKTGVLILTSSLNGMYVSGVFMPNAEYYENTTLVLYLFIFFLIFIIVLGTGLILINQYFILQPIRLLVSDIETIDLSLRPNYRMPESERLGYLPIRKALNSVLDTTSKHMKDKDQARHDLLLENQRVVLLMNSAADIIFEIDRNLRFVTVLGKGLERIGKASEDFTGKTVTEIFGKDGKNREFHYQKALEGHHSFYNWTYQSLGETLHFESSISPIYDENKQIVGAVGITRDVTEQQQKQYEIEHISTHDFLTGLFNRRYFNMKINDIDYERNYPLGVVMMDLNGLKILNDAYGHTFGDQALIEVSHVIQSFMKQKDILARIGGDEFAAIIPNTTEADIYQLKKNIAFEISKRKIANLDLSIAVGYAIKSRNDQHMDDILKEAEDYMYRIKLSEGMSIRNNAIKAILKTLTDKYKDEREHLAKVSQICGKMGKILNLHEDEIKELELAGLYHDIGKISIPDAILDKPGKLTKEEYDIMKKHTEAGYQILRAADAYSDLAEYALTHHERWDGKGYPRGLSGVEIPYFSRILSIVDAYEAMISKRVYKEAMSKEEAINEIIRCSGTQFDPDLAKIFVTKYLRVPWQLVNEK